MKATALRLAVSVVFVAAALWGVGADGVLSEMAHANAGWLAAAAALTAASFALGAVRWWMLLDGVDVRVGLANALRFTWIGMFFANVLPSGFGGDAVRAYMLGRQEEDMPTVTASVLVDRLTAVWALLGVGLVGVLIEGGTLPGSVITAVLLASAAVLGASVVLLTRVPAELAVRLLGRWPAVAGPVGRLADTLAVYRTRPRLLLQATGLSLAVQALVLVSSWCLMRALGVSVSLWVLAPAIPVALLATAVPVSLNGFGVRETVFRAMLVPAGVPAADAVAFSLTGVAIAAVISLPGAILWALTRQRRAAAAAEPLLAVMPQPVQTQVVDGAARLP